MCFFMHQITLSSSRSRIAHKLHVVKRISIAAKTLMGIKISEV